MSNTCTYILQNYLDENLINLLLDYYHLMLFQHVGLVEYRNWLASWLAARSPGMTVTDFLAMGTVKANRFAEIILCLTMYNWVVSPPLKHWLNSVKLGA